MKKYLLLSIALIGVYLHTYAQFEGGNGSAEQPYEISTIEQLSAIREGPYAHYILINDIDASSTRNWDNSAGSGFEPVKEFGGVLDGQGYIIDSLFFDMNTDENVAVISNMISGEVKNLGLTNVFMLVEVYDDQSSGHNNIASLIGRNYGIVKNCYAEGEITVHVESERFSFVGGIIGYNEGQVKYCHASVNIEGTAKANSRVFYGIGGLIGRSGMNPNIDCNDCRVKYSYATGNINIIGDYNMTRLGLGGLCGTVPSGRVEDCYATGNISGEYNQAGGLAGRIWGTARINGCYASGKVEESENELSGSINFFGGFGGFTPGPTLRIESGYWALESSTNSNSNYPPTMNNYMEMRDLQNYNQFSSSWLIESGDTLSFPYLEENPQSPPPGLYIPLQFFEQPSNDTVRTGSSVTLKSVVSGDTPIVYKWYHNGELLPGSHGETLTIPEADIDDEGKYHIEIYNEQDGSVRSDTITLTVLDCDSVLDGTAYIDSCGYCVEGATNRLPCEKDCHGDWGGSATMDDCENCIDSSETPCVSTPQFDVQLQDTTVHLGGTITLEVEVSGEGPLTYQWYHNGSPLPDSDAPYYTIKDAEMNDMGTYYVKASNPYDTTYSEEAQLTVLLPSDVVVYPIPVSEELFVDLRKWEEGVYDAILYDVKGALYMEKKLEGRKVNTMMIDELPPAIYILHISGGDKTINLKVQVKR